jgi:fatty acid desaturase
VTALERADTRLLRTVLAVLVLVWTGVIFFAFGWKEAVAAWVLVFLVVLLVLAQTMLREDTEEGRHRG